MTGICAKQTAGVGREAVIAGRDPEIAYGTVSGRRLAWPGGRNSAPMPKFAPAAARPRPTQVKLLTSPPSSEGETQTGLEGLGSVDSNLPFRQAPGGTPTNFLNARLKAASDS